MSLGSLEFHFSPFFVQKWSTECYSFSKLEMLLTYNVTHKGLPSINERSLIEYGQNLLLNSKRILTIFPNVFYLSFKVNTSF